MKKYTLREEFAPPLKTVQTIRKCITPPLNPTECLKLEGSGEILRA